MQNFRSQIPNTVLTLLFFCSLGLTVWGINIYRLTIINFKLLIAIVVLGAVLAYPLIKFVIKPTYKQIWILFTSIVIGGGIFYFSFLYLNSKFSSKDTKKEEFAILRTGNLGRGRFSHCRQPFAIIDFKGTEKELIFYCDYEKTISKYKTVQLEYSNGLLGFEVIKSKNLF